MVQNMEICSNEDCVTVALLGFEGSRKVECCRQHADDGREDMVHRRCGHCGYPNRFEGSKKATFCRQHGNDGMVEVVCKR